MPATIQHLKTSLIADDADTSLIRPSDWNSAHAVTLAPTGQEMIGGFSNANSVSFGTNTAGMITASFLAAAGVALAAGTNTATAGTVQFGSSAGNVTFGMATDGYITASAPAQATSSTGSRANRPRSETSTLYLSTSACSAKCLRFAQASSTCRY